jgi:hypothetical protein
MPVSPRRLSDAVSLVQQEQSFVGFKRKYESTAQTHEPNLVSPNVMTKGILVETIMKHLNVSSRHIIVHIVAANAGGIGRVDQSACSAGNPHGR